MKTEKMRLAPADTPLPEWALRELGRLKDQIAQIEIKTRLEMQTGGEVMERSSVPTADQLLKRGSELVHGGEAMTPCSDKENLTRLEIAFNCVFVREVPNVTEELYCLL